MSLPWITLLLAGTCTAIAQPVRYLLVEPASATRVALSGETVEFTVVIEGADRDANAVVQVSSRLWQSAGTLAAPISPAVTSEATLVAGRALATARATIPSVRSATEMWMRFQVEHQTNAATAFRIVALPEPPLLALARTAINLNVATSDLPQPLTDWLTSRGIANHTALESDIATLAPSLWLRADPPAGQIESAVLRIKHLALSGVPVVWFSSHDDFAATLPAVVHWHHLPDAQPVIYLPATWQTELANDLAVEYEFAKVLKSAIDPNSTARSCTATGP